MSEGSIFVVDDDPQIRRMMRVTLISQGFEVDDARTGTEGLERLRSARCDLALLDVNLPDFSGLELCREIRASSDTAIIMLTVRSSEKDKTAAFGVGADDFVTKPFSFPELMARIRAMLKRKRLLTERAANRLRLGDTEIDFEARQVHVNEQPKRLTPKEWGVLNYLANHANRTVSHRDLLRDVWGADAGDEKEYLRVFINRLRKKIEHSPENPEYLLTDPWIGYRLRLPS
jgi:two-component system, OmpR family, KDP operon response regulator KdpE